MKIDVNFSAFQIIDNVVYFSFSGGNGLYSYNVTEKELCFVSYFEAEKKDMCELHLQSILYDNKIYFIPYRGRYISIYDVINKKMSYIEINKELECTFIRAFEIGNRLWLIPQCLVEENSRRNICIFDLENNSIEDAQEINRFCIDNFSVFFCFGATESDNNIYIAVYATNQLLCIDTSTMNYKCIKIKDVNKLSSVDAIDNELWVTEVGTNIIRQYDKNFRQINHYIDEKLKKSTKRVYRSINEWKDKIYVIPGGSEYILSKGKETEHICNWTYSDSNYSGYIEIGQVQEYDGYMYIAPGGNGIFWRISREGIFEKQDMCFEQKEMEKILKNNGIVDGKQIVYEGAIDLLDYLRFI